MSLVTFFSTNLFARMRQLLFVMLGSACGGGLRFLVSRWLNEGSTMPWGTLAVNVLGCLIIGFVGSLPASGVSPQVRLLLTTGFCGGFTTFSTFSSESLSLLRDGHATTAMVYMGASLAVGLLAVAAGHQLARAISA